MFNVWQVWWCMWCQMVCDMVIFMDVMMEDVGMMCKEVECEVCKLFWVV